jgi:hypothetical protein
MPDGPIADTSALVLGEETRVAVERVRRVTGPADV